MRDDKAGIKKFKYFPTVYKLDEEGEFETIFGDRCSPINGRFDKNDPTILEKDISKELVILRDLYYETDDIPSYHNIVYLDIEIKIIGPLNAQTIKEANAPITSISMMDDDEKVCFILDEKNELEEIEEDGIKIIPCKDENTLIKKFLDKWEQMDPTIVVHYNGDFFDVPYLYYRIKRRLGAEVNRLSPVGIVDENPYKPDSPITIALVNSLDYLNILKKYITKEEASYKLGDIGLKYANLGKIEYDGSLDKLFKEDKKKFIQYNIRDIEIIKALEEKQKFIELTVMMCHICKVPYESIYYNTVLNEGATLTYLKRKNIIAPNKPTTTNYLIKELEKGDLIVNQRGTPAIEGIIHEIKDDYVTIITSANKFISRNIRTVKKKEGYSGGYLLEPIPGLYSNLGDLDFSSLYPSIIKSLNLGIESFIGRILTENNYVQNNSLKDLKLRNPNEIVTIQKLNKKSYTLKNADISIGELIKLIEKNNWVISPSGAFFDPSKPSIVCDVLKDWFKQREKYRKLKKEAGKNEDWVKYKFYDLYQHSFKILQNGYYGGMAINSFRFTDGHKIFSSAITNLGQILTKASIDFVNQYMLEQTGEKDAYVKASDTDSMFIDYTKLLKTRFPDLDLNNRKEKIKKLLLINDEIQKQSNLNLNNIAKELFNINKDHFFELKQEVLVEKAYWAGKRRYAMYITNKEGIEIEEFEMKGLDLMKSNFPPLFRNFGEKLIKDILFSVPKSEIDKNILEFKESLNSIDWINLMKPTGLKKMDEYIESYPNDNNIFSTLKLRCPINTRGASIYNDLLRYFNLNIKYPEFNVGDKMYLVYLKDNPYKLDIIGLNGYNDPPQILEFIEQYIDREKIFDSVFKNKLENLYQDLKWDLILNPNINKFFTF